MDYRRYAIYFTPAPGPLAAFGAAWLGWDAARGAPVPHLRLAGLDPREIAEATEVPRKYGFHATIKAPFRLADGARPAALSEAVASLAVGLAPVVLDRLAPARLGRFLALVPGAESPALQAMAARVVRDLDEFRAPLSEADLALRRRPGMSARQTANLLTWGYPHVMEDFRFHMTLTGPLARDPRDRVAAALSGVLPQVLPRPFVIDALSLTGEGDDGRFRVLGRYPLTG